MNKENVKDGGMSYPNILKLGSVSYVGEIQSSAYITNICASKIWQVIAGAATVELKRQMKCWKTP